MPPRNFQPKPGTKVLVVDDDPITLQALYERLTRAGYNVSIREEALGTARWVAHEKPDFVILDVCMPALTGGDLAQLIRRLEQTFQPVVILHSGLEKDELSRITQQSGAVAYIQKTANVQSFLQQFEQIVSAQRSKAHRVDLA